jgi:OB-fold nucleic acid binding protein
MPRARVSRLVGRGLPAHPSRFRKWSPRVRCSICGHAGSSHKGLWHDDRRHPIEFNPNAITACWIKCRSCPKRGNKLSICFDDGCAGRERVNSPFESESMAPVLSKVESKLKTNRHTYASPSVPSVMPVSKPPATFISDLRPSRVATIEATVAALEPTREFETRDGAKNVLRNGWLRDETGEISLVLWGSEVEMVQVGDRVRITEGWVKDYQGRPQISLGRSGRLDKVTVSGKS